MTPSPGIVISEEEFARVVALKAERDALDMEAQTARAELDRARIDLLEFKNKQKELAESNKSLGHELEIAQQAAAEADKKLSQMQTKKQLLEKRSATWEEQIVALKDQIVLRDSQTAKRDAQVQSLKSELDAARLDIMKCQVEKSKAQIAAQNCNDLQETIARLEIELRAKEQNESLNEKRLAEMQKALSDLEALVAKTSHTNAASNQPQATAVNLTTYDPAPFLEACSKSELLARITMLQTQKQKEIRSIYLRGAIIFTIALILVILAPDDDPDSTMWINHWIASWISTPFEYT